MNAAFSEFLRDAVNLDPGVTARARGGRDWLIAQIHGFPGAHSDFPPLYPAVDLKYGSFARNTKIREPADDGDGRSASSNYLSFVSFISAPTDRTST